MHQEIEPPKTRSQSEKEHAFNCYYRGWRDFMEGRPNVAPGAWAFHERDLYGQGHQAAARRRQGFDKELPGR